MNYIKFIQLSMLLTLFISSCSKKGTAVNEPSFGTYNFSTYTLDTFKFRVLLDGVVLSDSLTSPVGNLSRSVNFLENDTERKLQIIDVLNNNQLIADTVIRLHTGTTDLAVVQFLKGQQPFIPGTPLNESHPAAANYKIRFQYLTPLPGSAVPNFNPVKCVVTNTNNPSQSYLSIDTVQLNVGGQTRFYEAPAFTKFRVKLLQQNNSLIFNQNGPVLTLSNIPSGFNTAVIRGVSTVFPSSTAYEVRRVY